MGNWNDFCDFTILKKNHFHIWFTAKFRKIFLWIDQHFSYIENLKEKTLMDMIWILVSYKYLKKYV